MTSSGTMQSAIEMFARYCSDCIHRHVCKYTDDVLWYEQHFYRHGTGTGCVQTVTINCAERRLEVQERD